MQGKESEGQEQATVEQDIPSGSQEDVSVSMLFFCGVKYQIPATLLEEALLKKGVKGLWKK